MKNINSYLKALSVLVVLALLFSYSCSKERIEEKPLNEYASPNDYLNSKKQQEQEFIIDTNGTCPLVGRVYQTELCVAKNYLMLPGGDSVFFPYTLKLIEQYKPIDMIYAQMPTVASGNILETAGEVKVTTFKNGTELQLRSGCFYQIKMPNSSPKNYMHTYFGVNASSYIDWADNNSIFADTAGGYSNNISSFGWLNCASDKSSSNSSQITFTSKTDKLDNVAIFIYIPATKTVMQVYNAVSGNIPNGSSVKIIAIGVRANGRYLQILQRKKM